MPSSASTNSELIVRKTREVHYDVLDHADPNFLLNEISEAPGALEITDRSVLFGGATPSVPYSQCVGSWDRQWRWNRHRGPISCSPLRVLVEYKGNLAVVETVGILGTSSMPAANHREDLPLTCGSEHKSFT